MLTCTANTIEYDEVLNLIIHFIECKFLHNCFLVHTQIELNTMQIFGHFLEAIFYE